MHHVGLENNEWFLVDLAQKAGKRSDLAMEGIEGVKSSQVKSSQKYDLNPLGQPLSSLVRRNDRVHLSLAEILLKSAQESGHAALVRYIVKD